MEDRFACGCSARPSSPGPRWSIFCSWPRGSTFSSSSGGHLGALAVGLVALGGGFYYLRYFQNPDAVCKVTAPAARRRVFESLRKLATESRFWLALAGIVALAFAVNLVELLCSAGIPAVYTQVLALSQLPAWQYYAYLSLYILVFILDDLFVFVVAMKTLQITVHNPLPVRFAHLAGGGVLLAIGALLLLREWLMFG
jgi:hypothetical protein